VLRCSDFPAIAFVFLVITCGAQLKAQELTAAPALSVLPFELNSGFLVVVPGELEDLNGLRFIVDTGSTHTVIDRAIADRLHLHLQQRSRELWSVIGFIPMECAEVTGLRVGPIRLNRTQVLVTSLASYSEVAKNVDGIIGLDVLSRSNQLTIDYEKGTVSFQSIGDEADRPVPNILQMAIVIQGVPMRVVVDSGFQGILLYTDRLRNHLPRLHMDGKPKRVDIGQTHAIEVRLPGVQIAGPARVVAVWLLDSPHTDLTPEIDGILGLACLHARQVEFDFRAKRLRWKQ
jgi:predicted aspartyl protease